MKHTKKSQNGNSMKTSKKVNASSVAAAIGRYRFRSQKEKLLQEAIASALGQEGLDFKREVEVAPGSVIDFLVGDVGIEVKVTGGSTAVLRQIMRYLESDQVKSLVLITARAQSAKGFPGTIMGKEVKVVTLWAGFL